MRFTAIYRRAIYEIVVSCSGDGTDVVRVRIVVIIDGGVVDDCSVVDIRIGNVDVAEVIAAVSVPRAIWFAKAQREPSYTAVAEAAAAETYPDAPTAATKKTDKGGPIDWLRVNWSRAPSPAAANIGPAAIVIGSKAPRLIVHPGPAPWADPAPGTGAVGRPANFDGTGIPNMAVLGDVAPIAVVVQIVVTSHVARNVPRGNCVIFLQVAVFGPTIQVVGSGRAIHCVVNLIYAGEFGAFSAAH